jgi:hypothetical protein
MSPKAAGSPLYSYLGGEGFCLSIVGIGAGEMLCCISHRVLILERETLSPRSVSCPPKHDEQVPFGAYGG